MRLSYKAEIDVITGLSLEEVAKQLTNEIDILVFIADESGRFEEVPAYTAMLGELEFVLSGVPEDVESDGYFLQLTSRSDIDVQEYIEKYGEKYFGGFPCDESMVDESGYVNATGEVLRFLRESSVLEFKVAEQ
ncbi:MAG: hypothetical protein P8103_17285 [Candidatus Thiodiazotropha sp.]